MNNFLNKIGEIVAGRKSRWVTLIVWVLVVGILSSVWPQVNSEETNDSNLLPDTAMSVEIAKIVDEQFPNDTAVPLLLVWYRDGGLS